MSDTQMSASKQTILIVDHIAENLQLLAGMLSQQGYIVRLAPEMISFYPDSIGKGQAVLIP